MLSGHSIGLPLQCAAAESAKKKQTRPFLRRMADEITEEGGMFENFILAAILVNAALMGVSDYSVIDSHGVPARENEYGQASFRNKFVFYCEAPFLALFTLECVLKIISLGVVKYFKDPWNDLVRSCASAPCCIIPYALPAASPFCLFCPLLSIRTS